MTILEDYVITYDTEASGPFVEGELLTFSGGAVGELQILRDLGLAGKMYVSIHSGSVPANNETITGGTSSATAAVDDTVDAPYVSRFPFKIRDDTSYDSTTGNLRWDGGALGTTHSCLYDAEATGPFVVGETITFSGGAVGELIVLTDNGTDGELFLRMTNATIPADNETISSSGTATAVINGNLENRTYQPVELHYWLRDLGDDSTSIGNDDHDRTKFRPTGRVFTTIIDAKGTCNIDADMSYRMYGGSWSQNSGADEWGGLDVAIVDKDGLTEPVLIQDNALLSTTTTEYWKNFYNGNAAAACRIMVQYRVAGVDTDLRLLRGRSLEFQSSYFTAPQVTLGVGVVTLSLATADDGNNQTAAGTVATWTDAVLTEGLALVDHNNGNGAQPYWGTIDRGSRTKTQTHERMKWVQRRGTAETIHGLNAALIVGNDMDIPYDTEALGPFTEGETLTFSSGGTALLLALDDQGTSGTLYCQRLTGLAPSDNDTMTASISTTTAAVNGAVPTSLITNNLVGTFTGAGFNPTNKGITLDAADADVSDKFVDLLGASQSSPNNQTGTINTDAANTITLYPYDGAATDPAGDPEPDFDFRVLNTTLSGAGETAVVTTVAIPSWVPTTGSIRVTTDAGVRRLIAYTSWTGSTFTIPSTDFTGDNATAGVGVMPAPMDGVGDNTFTGVYASDVLFVYAVFNGSGATPKQPSVGTVTYGSGGFSLNVNLSDDG